MTQAAICAMVYANTKESRAHKEYKALIEASLASDSTFTETKQESTWRDIDGWALIGSAGPADTRFLFFHLE